MLRPSRRPHRGACILDSYWAMRSNKLMWTTRRCPVLSERLRATPGWPCGPAARTPCLHCRGPRFIPGRGTRSPGLLRGQINKTRVLGCFQLCAHPAKAKLWGQKTIHWVPGAGRGKGISEYGDFSELIGAVLDLGYSGNFIVVYICQNSEQYTKRMDFIRFK